MTERKGQRMYFFVMYNLSGIQKGIQAGHAALEYYLTYGKHEAYKDFVENHKTFILLDGGGSEDMKERANELYIFNVDYEVFHEPDLNNSLSAISFIVPEDIYGIDLKEYEGIEDVSSYVEFARYLKRFRLASN